MERILLSCCNTNQSEFEEYLEGINTKWSGESEQQNITIESESLVSIIPVLEEGLQLIKELVTSYTETKEKVFVFSLLPLENEVFRAIGLILTTQKAAQKLLKQKQKQSQQVNPKVAQFYEQALIQNIDLDMETFTNFLLSLRSDPQIQSKCTKNSFLFLIEFFLDPTNLKKVHGNVLRIFSRHKIHQNIHQNLMALSTDNFYDSIKCLNLPLNKNSNTILWCRKCHRCSTAGGVTKSKRELIFSANWHQSLWKSRCQCGGARRMVNF